MKQGNIVYYKGAGHISRSFVFYSLFLNSVIASKIS